MSCEGCLFVTVRRGQIEQARAVMADIRKTASASIHLRELEGTPQTLRLAEELLGSPDAVFDFYANDADTDEDIKNYLSEPENRLQKLAYEKAVQKTSDIIATAMGEITLAQESCSGPQLVLQVGPEETRAVTVCTSRYQPAAGRVMPVTSES